MEYFIVARSFAAPWFSDTSNSFVEADSPEEALVAMAAEYSHPAGLYAAEAYASADAMHKGQKHLAQWLSNHARVLQEKTAALPSHSYRGIAPGRFEIDGELVEVDEPKEGFVVAGRTRSSRAHPPR